MKVLDRVVGLFAGKKRSAKMIVVLSPTGTVKDEQKIVCELFRAGLQVYHLRKPRWSQEKITEWVNSLPHEYRSRIVLHQFPKLVSRLELGGFHLSPDMPEPGDEAGELSAQCASYSDIVRIGGDCRYVMLGPIFRPAGTDSRPSLPPARTPQEYAAIVKYWHQNGGDAKVFAFGRIHAGNVHLCKKLGFDGIAVVSAIWNAKTDPVKAFKALCKKW